MVTFPLPLSNACARHHSPKSDLTHDDGALDGQLEVHKGEADNGDDTLHAVNLLTQEDVHGGQRAHLLQARLHLQQRWATACEQGMHMYV